VDLELTPLQAPEITAAIAAALGAEAMQAADPWWQAGIDEALET
jgi:hypothetical protein